MERLMMEEKVVRDARAHAMAILAKGAPDAAQALIRLLDAADREVVAVASQEILTRWIPAACAAADSDFDIGAPDLRRLSPPDRATLREAAGTIQRLLAAATA